MRRTGQLRIEENYDEDIALSSFNSSSKKSEDKSQNNERERFEDDVIWNIDIRSRNSES